MGQVSTKYRRLKRNEKFQDSRRIYQLYKRKWSQKILPIRRKIQIKNDRGELKYQIEVGKLVGAGASCLAYEVIVDDFYPPKKNMILKEIFPNYKQEEITDTRDNNNPINLHLII